MRKFTIITGLLLIGWAFSIWSWSQRGLAGEIESVATWIPQNAVATVVVKKPAAWIEKWEKSPAWQGIISRPETQAILANPGLKQADAVVKLVEAHLKKDRWALAKSLLGGGVFVAVLPQGQLVVITEAEDAQLLQDVHEFLLTLMKIDAESKGEKERIKSATYRGVTAWSVNKDEVHAIVGNRFILTNKPELMREIIDRVQEGQDGSLEGNPKFAAAQKALAKYDLALYLDLETFRLLSDVRKGFENSQSPLPVLLLGGFVTAVQQAPWVAVGLDVTGDRVRGTVRMGEVTDWPEKATFAVAPAGEGSLPPLEVSGMLLSASFYRNLHDFYAQKNELFPERTSGLIFFENMMGIFFTGRNFTEEVLAELEPHVRLVVATQRYAPEVGTPAVQLPAVALVFRMKEPAKFQPIVEEGFQKALGLINFVRGQDAKPGLILDRPIYNGVKYTLAYFNPETDGDKSRVDIRFNFSPVLACRGENLILSTAEPLAKDILDALSQPEAAVAKVRETITTHVELMGKQIARLLELNKEALIAQNMAEKGHSREEAETELARLVWLLERLGRLRLTETFSNHSGRWDFQIELSGP